MRVAGRVRSAWPASSVVMIATGVSERRALVSASAASAVSTCSGFGELAGGGDDVRRWHRERDVEVAVLEIELAGADVRLVIPALHVVVDGDARIPLRDLVERAVVSHAPAALRGHVEVPGEPRSSSAPGASGAARSTRIVVP